jgi:hypothetical protein
MKEPHKTQLTTNVMEIVHSDFAEVKHLGAAMNFKEFFANNYLTR